MIKRRYSQDDVSAYAAIVEMHAFDSSILRWDTNSDAASFSESETQSSSQLQGSYFHSGLVLS